MSPQPRKFNTLAAAVGRCYHPAGMRTLRPIGCVALLLTACAASPSPPAQPDVDLTVAIGQHNVRIGEKTFALGDAVRAGFAGACANGCDHVEIHAIPTARYDALRLSYAAAVDNDAGQIVLRLGESQAVRLIPGAAGRPDAACTAEVVLRDDAVDVFTDGVAVPADHNCAKWGVSVCDVGSLGGALAAIATTHRATFDRGTCIFADDDAAATSLDAVLQEILRGAPQTPFSFRHDRREAPHTTAAVTDALVAQGAALTACYDKELETTSAAMSLVVHLLVAPGGQIERVGVLEQRMTTPSFEACLEDAFLTQIQLPASDGAYFELYYPLNFSPR